MGAPVEPEVPDVGGEVAREEREHAADVVVVDVGDHRDVDVAVGRVEATQPRLEERPGVGRAPVHEHPPRRTRGAWALDEEAVAQPCGQHLHVDRRRHAWSPLPPPPQTRAATRGCPVLGRACPVRPRFRRPAARTYHVPMPGESLFNALEPLLEQVSKPIQYVGGELNSTVKDWNVGGHGPDGEELTTRWALMYPDAYEVGRAQPGRHDPLRGAQRAARRPRRAHVCRVARPRGPDARARACRSSPSTRTASVRDFDLFGLSVLDRARLHQHAHRARPRRHPAARGRPRPTTTRSSSPAATRRSTPSRSPTSSTPPSSATARRPCSRSPTSSAPGRREGRAGWPRASCCCAWPAPAGSTCPRSTTSPTCPTAGSSGSPRAADAPGVPWRVSKHTVMDLDAWPYPKQPLVPLAESVHERMSVEIFRGCTRGCRFCQAGMITRPVRERSHHRHRRDGRARPGRNGFRGGRAAVAVARPTTPRSPTSPRAWPTATRAPRPGCRCRRPASTRSTSTSPTS